MVRNTAIRGSVAVEVKLACRVEMKLLGDILLLGRNDFRNARLAVS